MPGAHPAAARAARALFRAVMVGRDWHPPPLPGVELLEARATDGVPVRGWLSRSTQATDGTVVVVHGLMRNATLDGIPDLADRFQRLGCATCAVDLRCHGRSGDAVPSFGAAESLDVTAALDACDRARMPRPYVLVGGSLGALTCQLVARRDRRVAGVMLVAMPASPWFGAQIGGRAIADLARRELSARMPPAAALPISVALGVVGRMAVPVARLCDRALGGGALAAADILRWRTPPANRPLVLSVIGDADPFDWRPTYRAWRAWYPEQRPRPLRVPADAPDQRAWFVLAPGHVHPPDPQDILHWAPLYPLLDDFVVRSLRDRLDD